MSASLRRAVARVTVLAVLATGLLVAAPPPPSAEAAAGDLTISGRGWGHGRGMGQYGAVGYAVDHGWSAQQILGHYYGGTTLATNGGNPNVAIEITRQTGLAMAVQGKGLTINGTALGSAVGAVRLTRTASNTLQAETAPSCNGPWRTTTTYPSGATVATTAATADRSTLLRLCGADDDRAYRGSLQSTVAGGVQYTVNRLALNSYLRSVVPHEMPASWADRGNGRGMQALMAQTVAARSYVMAPRNVRASGATGCDTTACQVYGGAATVSKSGVVTSREVAQSDTAVSSTSGWVMKFPNGSIAMTEYSSSTGGYTAGGTFPAVPDAGDAYASNPNRTWSVTMSAADVAAKLGTGPIASMAVTARNGLGADGGRATNVTVTSTSGSTTSFTGNQVRTRLGLKSDWFSVSGMTTAQAQAMVKALYEDLLGRTVDASGLKTWTNQLLAGNAPAVVVDTLTRSGEYRRVRITQAYQEVFGRAPDAAGLAMWVKEVDSGRLGIDDVKRKLIDSGEFYSRAGGTPRGYVDRLYQSLLQRQASTEELDSWTRRYASLGRSGIATALWGSKESAHRRVEVYYPILLGRTVDRGGLETWANQLLRNGEPSVRNGLAASAEYRKRALTRFPS